jgi:hypothetical protein
VRRAASFARHDASHIHVSAAIAATATAATTAFHALRTMTAISQGNNHSAALHNTIAAPPHHGVLYLHLNITIIAKIDDAFGGWSTATGCRRGISR